VKHLAPAAAVLLCATIVLAGCATLFANKNPDVRFASDPDGAKVYVNGDLMGTTPVKIQLASNKTYTIEFRKEGFQTRTYHLNNHVGGVWIVLDILGGFWPIVIDLATGSWYEFDSTDVKAILEK
jgi:hypothetical protein